MTAPALLLAVSGVAALFALVSFVFDGGVARRLAIAALARACDCAPQHCVGRRLCATARGRYLVQSPQGWAQRSRT
jgi:hypothetical protein